MTTGIRGARRYHEYRTNRKNAMNVNVAAFAVALLLLAAAAAAAATAARRRPRTRSRLLGRTWILVDRLVKGNTSTKQRPRASGV